MGFHFIKYVPESESVNGGFRFLRSVPNPTTTPPPLSSAATPPSALFQCLDCSRLFPSETAFIQHQIDTNMSCGIVPAKPSSFSEKLKKAKAYADAQQQANVAPTSVPKRRYYYESHHFKFQPASAYVSDQFVFLDTVEGSGSNDPFGDKTLDLVSQLDNVFVGNFGTQRDFASNHEELDLELKL